MIAVYPGSFDPLTNGHLDIIKRASLFSEKLIVAVLNNISKKPLFTAEERVEHILFVATELKIKNIEVLAFSGLTANLAKEKSANIIIRGLRTGTDFDSEQQFAQYNKILNTTCETMFMMTNPKYSYLSSGGVKEVALFNGNIDEMLHWHIKEAVTQRLNNKRGEI